MSATVTELNTWKLKKALLRQFSGTGVPSIEQQKAHREMYIRQEVMKIYEKEDSMLVGIACDAAARVIQNDGSAFEALDAAFDTIVGAREMRLRALTGVSHE